jgi:putative membrane protein
MPIFNLPDSIWFHWHAHPEVLLATIIIQSAYLLGVGPIREKYRLSERHSPQKTLSFTCGVLLIFLSLSSPLHILSDHYLFSAHMLQHVIITLISPPLLIIGTPDWLISPIFQKKPILKTFKLIFSPLIAIIFFNFVFSIWHIPALYELSVKYHWVHVSEHILFVLAAIIMWWPLCSQINEIPRLIYPLQMMYLFVMSLAQVIVFGIITFASDPIYLHYVEAPRIWNISPLVDQQLGGIIMKVGSGFLFLALLIVAFFKWANQSNQHDHFESKNGIIKPK